MQALRIYHSRGQAGAVAIARDGHILFINGHEDVLYAVSRERAAEVIRELRAAGTCERLVLRDSSRGGSVPN